MKRVYSDNIDIDQKSIKEFYKTRAIEKANKNVDSPVVLVGDTDESKIDEWTNFEIENRLSLLKLDKDCVVLELGCGTGRLSKYITDKVDKYVGIDYVKEFIDLIDKREDIVKGENTYFINKSFKEFLTDKQEYPFKDKFNRFVISGGVLMYINDEEVKECMEILYNLLDEHCIVYISEPISLEERLTLNKFYSKELDNEYSGIYRTLDDYKEIFKVLYDGGFKEKVSEEFFYDDIKKQKETKQWLFVLER